MMFQSTHPHGVRHFLTLAIADHEEFQSTHPHGVRRANGMLVVRKGMFQSTHPHGVRRLGCLWWRQRGWFQSTHPHGVRRSTTSTQTRTQSFNPRTHMGCDLALQRVGVDATVSIHAPTWGATPSRRQTSERQAVSIHAPTWGATRQRSRPKHYLKFQSTHPHGVRHLFGLVQRPYRCFNPRTHMGCDFPFQLFRLTMGFNPRTHMGCDIVGGAKCYRCRVSIHAPTWGATLPPV